MEVRTTRLSRVIVSRNCSYCMNNGYMPKLKKKDIKYTKLCQLDFDKCIAKKRRVRNHVHLGINVIICNMQLFNF